MTVTTVAAKTNHTFTTVEAARKLGVSLHYLQTLLWTGKIRGRKVDGRWQIPAAAIEQHQNQKRAGR